MGARRDLPRASVDDALRRLAHGAGPSQGKLAHPDKGDAEAITGLMRLVELPGATADEKAYVLLRIIEEEAGHIGAKQERPLCYHALGAAMCLPHDAWGDRRSTSMKQRFRDASTAGDLTPFLRDFLGRAAENQPPKDAWLEGVRELGHLLVERLEYLRGHPEDWDQYRRPPTGEVPEDIDPEFQPFLTKRQVVTSRVRNRVVYSSVSDSCLLALAKVDHVSIHVTSWGGGGPSPARTPPELPSPSRRKLQSSRRR